MQSEKVSRAMVARSVPSFLLGTIIIDNFLFDYGQEKKNNRKSKSRSGAISGDFNTWSGRILETGKSRAMPGDEPR